MSAPETESTTTRVDTQVQDEHGGLETIRREVFHIAVEGKRDPHGKDEFPFGRKRTSVEEIKAHDSCTEVRVVFYEKR